MLPAKARTQEQSPCADSGALEELPGPSVTSALQTAHIDQQMAVLVLRWQFQGEQDMLMGRPASVEEGQTKPAAGACGALFLSGARKAEQHATHSRSGFSLTGGQWPSHTDSQGDHHGRRDAGSVSEGALSGPKGDWMPQAARPHACVRWPPGPMRRRDTGNGSNAGTCWTYMFCML